MALAVVTAGINFAAVTKTSSGIITEATATVSVPDMHLQNMSVLS